MLPRYGAQAFEISEALRRSFNGAYQRLRLRLHECVDTTASHKATREARSGQTCLGRERIIRCRIELYNL